MKINKGKLQKLIHRTIEDAEVMSYSESLLFAIFLSKKIIDMLKLDSSTEKPARSEARKSS